MTGSWTDLTNPDGAGRMFILDDFQEAIGEANLINGFYLNTTDAGEIEDSKETLLEQKENARGFSTNSVQNLVNGTAVIHQAWNGDIVNVRNQFDEEAVVLTRGRDTELRLFVEGLDLTADPGNTRVKLGERIFKPLQIEFVPANAAHLVRVALPTNVEPGKQQLTLFFGSLESPGWPLEIN